MVMSVNSQRSQDRILTQRNELHRITSKEKQRRHKLKGPRNKIATERNKVTKEKKQSTGRTFTKRQVGWHALKIRNQHSQWVLTLVDSSLRSLRRQATGVRRHVVPTRTGALCHDLMPGFRQRSPLQPDQYSFWTRTRHVQAKMDCLQQKTSCLFTESVQFSKASSPNTKHVMRERSRCCSCATRSAAGSMGSLVLARRRSCKNWNHNSYPRYQKNSYRHSNTQAHTPPCMLPPQFLPA